MMIHDITVLAGRNKARTRVGRGRGSGLGKTSGRGHKGDASRSGYSRAANSEGGQMPFARRIPKRGFSNAPFRREYHIVNLKTLESRFDAGTAIDLDLLVKAGVVRDAKLPLKVLGEGGLTKKFAVTAAKFSASARAKIEAAGGSTTEIVKVKWTRSANTAAKKKDAAKPKK